MKKSLSIMLIIVMALSISFKASAETSLDNDSVVLSGIMMTKEKFVSIYATSQRVSIDAGEFESCSLKMSEFTTSQKSLSFNAELISEDNENKTFVVSGDLFSGYKNQIAEMNSVILDASSSSGEVSVLLFEMLFNVNESIAVAKQDLSELETYTSCFWTSDPITASSSIRVYLSSGNIVYMFEEALPTVFQNYNREYTQMSDSTKDMLWFASLISPTVEPEAVSENEDMIVGASETITRSTDAGSTMWIGDTTYQYSFDVYGTTYEQRSMPFGYYRICDVSTGDSTWTAEFYILENTRVNGEVVSGVGNLIRYKNVQVSIGVGENAQISSSIHGGVVKENGSGSSKTYVLDILSATIEWWDMAVSVYNALSQLGASGRTVALNAENFVPHPSGTTAVATCVPYNKGEFYTNSYINDSEENYLNVTDSSHYLIFQAKINSTLSSTIEQTNEMGCVEFKWDVFIHSTLEDVATDVRERYTEWYINTH